MYFFFIDKSSEFNSYFLMIWLLLIVNTNDLYFGEYNTFLWVLLRVKRIYKKVTH